MFVIQSHDDQTGTFCKLEIPGNQISEFQVSKELQKGKYPSHFAFSHKGANLEINFRKTEEFCEFASWIFGEIHKASQT